MCIRMRLIVCICVYPKRQTRLTFLLLGYRDQGISDFYFIVLPAISLLNGCRWEDSFFISVSLLFILQTDAFSQLAFVFKFTQFLAFNLGKENINVFFPDWLIDFNPFDYVFQLHNTSLFLLMYTQASNNVIFSQMVYAFDDFLTIKLPLWKDGIKS